MVCGSEMYEEEEDSGTTEGWYRCIGGGDT